MNELEQLRHSPGISRRKFLVRGAIAAGGVVWVPPLVESFTSVAAATSAPSKGQGFSFVTVLLSTVMDGATRYYRAKFSFVSTSLGSCTIAIPTCGSTFHDGDCFKGGGDPTTPTSVTVESGCPSHVSGQYCLSTSGVPSFELLNDSAGPAYTVAAYVVHQGRCCASGTGSNGYKSYAGPSGAALSPGGRITFPAPTNGPSC